MHDLDRTQPEMSWERNGFEMEAFNYEGEGEGEVYGETFIGGPLSAAEVMELAAELLGVANEAELDHFLGDLISNIGRTVGQVIKSPVGQALGGVLKGIAKKALPVAGGALGSLIMPGVGTAAGSALASAAGQMFGLELEGLSAEDREFEVAQRYVQLATEAAQQAALAPPTASPQTIAQQAVMAAAQQHAPGLLHSMAMPAPAPEASHHLPRSGRWIRKGRAIILLPS